MHIGPGDRGSPVLVGCAGWNIPTESSAAFDSSGTHLERYARRFSCVEVNSSFYKPHGAETYARWAAAVPEHFRFAVKVPREITHRLRLIDAGAPLDRFLAGAGALGDRLGPLLVQLPPSLRFDAEIAAKFFEILRGRFSGAVVCEPRHPTWFEPMAEQALVDFSVARVAADPAVVPAAGQPGGSTAVRYYRLHGSPRMYYSLYSDEQLTRLATDLRAAPPTRQAWCIFDNTAAGAATKNALELGGAVADSSNSLA